MSAESSADEQVNEQGDSRGSPAEGQKTTVWKRRTFVSATAAAGGAAVGGAMLAVSSFGDESAPAAPSSDVSLTINGERHALTVDNRTSLLDLLRERLGLTGTKKGCDQGACGACTVLVNDKRVNACLTLAVRCDSSAVTTIEGLADGDRLHPLQKAFVERDAFQCGYCTPGQIMSGVGCISEGHAGSREEIREWMSGNICRCGCYVNIVSAVRDAADGR
ncbi:xanthine dehydrogenase YagT iron-sulfur-binding subunit [Streptomyces melanosporofaciens]|uniref:Xanthine dehydrogenase YagT iron-sulfur-binding subunit n=2 Tax=Streptomyces melanosporofaciens TaxID=67327 RepID=A0A1H5CB06_STRMJ|nr:xanthine dehydrogenase YagT iron-sulfur-binding subunit [Streptomyces melanosporofaciens]